MNIPTEHSKLSIRELIKLGYRIVHKQRKRTLLKRGEVLYWSHEHYCWMWNKKVI